MFLGILGFILPGEVIVSGKMGANWFWFDKFYRSRTSSAWLCYVELR